MLEHFTNSMKKQYPLNSLNRKRFPSKEQGKKGILDPLDLGGKIYIYVKLRHFKYLVSMYVKRAVIP